MASIMNEKTSTKTSKSDKQLAQKYQKKTDKEHVLDTPDTYTGSMTLTDYDTFVMEAETIIAKQVAIVPGLYKIVDEAIVNARDHVVRMHEQQAQVSAGAGSQVSALPVTEIAITIDEKEGTITIYNNGNFWKFLYI
jgi:DNA topoisomerase-2